MGRGCRPDAVCRSRGLPDYSQPAGPLSLAFDSEESGDRYQKTVRIKKGDVVAVLPGVAHWCYNDGQVELVAITIVDHRSAFNQLDPHFRTFYLAGDMPAGVEGQGAINQSNIVRAFDTDFMAEAMGISKDLMRKVQKDERGFLVKVTQGDMRSVAPEWGNANGVKEESCNIMLMQNVDRSRGLDVRSKKAGWLNSINKNKLFLLGSMDLSAERGSLRANATLAPHWLINAHSIIFVIRGEGCLQVVDDKGTSVYGEIIKQGQLTVIPQYFASIMTAGSKGIEWISFRTTSLQMRNPLVGHMSTFKVLPIKVITNSYRINISEALKIKFTKEHHMMLFPPSSTSY